MEPFRLGSENEPFERARTGIILHASPLTGSPGVREIRGPFPSILVPSSPSRLDYRVESFELDACIRRGELPVNRFAGGIARLLPRPGLIA